MKQFLRLGALLAAFLFSAPSLAQTITPPQTPVGIYSTTGALKGNGSGTVSQAACADLSNGATGCSTTVGTMATQGAGAVAITGGTVDGTTVGATAPGTGKFTTMNATTSYSVNGNLALSATAPTIANGGGLGTVGTITGTAAAFDVTAGTGAASVFVITLPSATNGWVCNGNDVTTHSTTVSSIQQTVGTNNTTTVTMGAYTDVSTLAAVGTSDHLRISCMAY